MSNDIIEAMKAVNQANAQGLQLKGKKYTEVSTRVEVFRQHFKSYSLESELVSDDGQRVVVKAYIRREDGTVVATGYAEEIRGSSNVNRTSAIENCETSAWGRALACLGLHGGQIASANELTAAKRKDTTINENLEAEIKSKKTLVALNQWNQDHAAEIARLQEEDPDAYQRLYNVWLERQQEIENGST